MKIPISGYVDTELGLLVIDKYESKSNARRPKTKPAKLIALVLGEIYAKMKKNESGKNLSELWRELLPYMYGDERAYRQAVKTAKERESEFFKLPHKAGQIIYGDVGAIWFSDRAMDYDDVMVGHGWIWLPTMTEAKFVLLKAERN